jgi:hypothetical protein
MRAAAAARTAPATTYCREREKEVKEKGGRGVAWKEKAKFGTKGRGWLMSTTWTVKVRAARPAAARERAQEGGAGREHR